MKEYPANRVLTSSELPQQFVVSPEDTYVNVFSEAERNIIIKKYQSPNLFNGPCVRLDSIKNGIASISPVCFYDFLCCNIAGIYNKDMIAGVKMSAVLAKYGKLNTFEKVLAVKELPNIIGTSTLLTDPAGNYMLVERNTKMSIGSGTFACTSSGSMSIDDVSGTTNYVVNCAERELREELGIGSNLKMTGIVIPLQKMQPIIMLTGQVFRPWAELYPAIRLSQDFSKENNRAIVIPKGRALQLVAGYQFTEVAAYQILLDNNADKVMWNWACKHILNVGDYYVEKYN